MGRGGEGEHTQGGTSLPEGEGAVGSLGLQSGEYGPRLRSRPYSSRLKRARGCPTSLALTVRHQAVIFVLVQLDEGGVPAAVRCPETAGSLCFPGWGQQCEEAFIFGGRERAAWGGGRN